MTSKSLWGIQSKSITSKTQDAHILEELEMTDSSALDLRFAMGHCILLVCIDVYRVIEKHL